MQRRVETPRETQEITRQEAPQSTEDLSAVKLPQNPITVHSDASRQPQPAKERIKWPRMGNDKEWLQLDEDLDKILEVTLGGSVEKKINTLSTIAYNLAKERFGVEERAATRPREKQANRREKKIQSLRREIKILSKQFKKSTADEREGIKTLTSGLRDQLRRLRKAEQMRKLRKDRETKRAQFIKDPFRFTRNLLGEAKSGILTSSREEVEEHLKSAHCDLYKDGHLDHHPKIRSVANPSKDLDASEPSWKEMMEVIKRARTSSAPGPNGLPYKIYKKCPQLQRRLWKLFRKIWSKGSIPESWKVAEGCFVPKEEGSSTISQFRTISLLNVEAKIFFQSWQSG